MSGTTSTDINQNRVDVLGVSVDQSTTWVTSPPAAATTLGTAFTGANRIITRALNFLQTSTANAGNATNAFVSRFNTIIGEETAADAPDWAAIGSNLITAVAALKAGGGGGGGTWGSITGTLASQTDLQAALTAAAAAGANTATWGDITGTLTSQNDLHLALGDAAMAAQWGHITGTITTQTDLNTALNGKQATLIGTATAGQNLKTVNNQTLLGTGDVTIDTSTAWGSITGTLSGQSDLQAALNDKADASDLADKQDELISGTNIKTINGTTLLGSGDVSTAVTLAGDVVGATTATVVEKLRGREIAPTAPTNGQTLAWNQTANRWEPSAGGAAGSVTALRSRQLPVCYRVSGDQTLFGANFWALGHVGEPGPGTFYTILTNENGVSYSYSPASVNLDRTSGWSRSTGLAVNLATAGYLGTWSSFIGNVGQNGAFGYDEVAMTFTQTTTALRHRRYTASPASPGAPAAGAVTLLGLPSGYDIITMWACKNAVAVIINNLVYRAAPIIHVQPNVSASDNLIYPDFTFAQVTASELSAITTKTRLYLADGRAKIPPPPNNYAVYYRMLVWGTAPANTAVLYDEETDQWISLTLPYNHNGGANTIVIFPGDECKLGAYDPATGDYYICYPLTDPNDWTLCYRTNTNRRLVLLFSTHVPAFLPASTSASSFTVEAYRDKSVDTVGVYRGDTGNTASHPFPAEYFCIYPIQHRYFLSSTTAASPILSFTHTRQTAMSVHPDQQTFTAIVTASWSPSGTTSTTVSPPATMPTSSFSYSIPTTYLGTSGGRTVFVARWRETSTTNLGDYVVAPSMKCVTAMSVAIVNP